MKVEGVTNAQECFYGVLVVTQIRNAHAMGGIAGKARDGMLVVDNADRNALPAQATNDAQPLIIAPDYDSTRNAAKVERGVLVHDINCGEGIHAAALVEKLR